MEKLNNYGVTLLCEKTGKHMKFCIDPNKKRYRVAGEPWKLGSIADLYSLGYRQAGPKKI